MPKTLTVPEKMRHLTRAFIFLCMSEGKGAVAIRVHNSFSHEILQRTRAPELLFQGHKIFFGMVEVVGIPAQFMDDNHGVSFKYNDGRIKRFTLSQEQKVIT